MKYYAIRNLVRKHNKEQVNPTARLVSFNNTFYPMISQPVIEQGKLNLLAHGWDNKSRLKPSWAHGVGQQLNFLFFYLSITKAN